MKKFLLFLILQFVSIVSFAQYRYSIEECWDMTKNNYPSIRYLDLIRKSEDYSISNAQNGITPSVDRVKPSNDLLSSPLLGSNINNFSLNVNTNVKDESLSANLFVLSERVNNLYFSCVLLKHKISLNEVYQLQLIDVINHFTANGNGNSNKEKSEESIEALLTYKDKLVAERAKLTSLRNIYLVMLSKMIGKTLTENTQFDEPSIDQYISANALNVEYHILDSYYSPFNPLVPNVKAEVNSMAADNYELFKVAKIPVKTVNLSTVDSKSFNSMREDLLNIDVSDNKDHLKSRLDYMCNSLNDTNEKIRMQREVVLISYNQAMCGLGNVDMLIRNLIYYNELHYNQAVTKAQLMMEVNTYMLLY